MSKRDAPFPLTLSPSSMVLVGIMIVGMVGLLLIRTELVLFYFVIFAASAFLSLFGIAEFNFGRSIESILEDSDEITETLVDAIFFGTIGLLAGLVIAVLIGKLSYYSIIFFAPFSIGALAPFSWFQENYILKTFSKTAMGICTSFAVGFCEETGFRGPPFVAAVKGFSMATGSNTAGFIIATGIFSTFFAFYHVFRYGSEVSLGNYQPIISLFVMSCIWSFLSYRFGLLTASMSHAINNSLATLVGCLLEVGGVIG